MKQHDKLIKLIAIKVAEHPKLSKSFNFSNVHQKYFLTDYLIDILYVLKTGIAWRDLRSHINWISVYKTYCKLVSFKIIEACYQDLLDKYLSKSLPSKMGHILTDTSFVPNKHGHDVIGFNHFYNRKRGTKISLITDSDGIPLDVKCYAGNRYDSKLLDRHLNEIKDNNPIKSYHSDKRHNRYFLADAGYDSKENHEKLKLLGYVPKIAKNKRNSKKKQEKLTAKDKQIYKKRLNVEIMFKRIKDSRRITNRYDCKIGNFKTFIYLALVKILLGRMR